MRIITAFIFTLLLSNFADSASLSEYFHHDIPQPVLLGETARIELQSFSGHKNYYNGALFYRMQGESDFHSLKMNEEGFILYAEIDTKKLRCRGSRISAGDSSQIGFLSTKDFTRQRTAKGFR